MSFQWILESGRPVMTAELCPPKGTDLGSFMTKAALLKGIVDAVNLTDNQRSVMRLSSLFASHIIHMTGLEPIMQLSCRDRNRLALQSDLLGANSLGIKNILCLTGDNVKAGDHPDAKPVFDLTSVGLLKAIRQLNSGKDLAENKLEGCTNFFSGAVVNPNVPNIDNEVEKMQRKIDSGAYFFQTQAVYERSNLERLKESMEKRKIKTKLLVGILLLKSAKNVHFLNRMVPGVKIPLSYAEEFEKLDPTPETLALHKDHLSISIALRQMNEYVSFGDGFHLMTIHREELLRPLISAYNQKRSVDLEDLTMLARRTP